MKTTFIAKPMKNVDGDIISPGDRVFVVTLSTKRIRTYKGIYLGLREDKSGNCTSYTVEHFPGFRYEQDGEDKYTNVDWRTGKTYTYKYPKYVKVPDDKYSRRRASFNGRIFKIG